MLQKPSGRNGEQRLIDPRFPRVSQLHPQTHQKARVQHGCIELDGLQASMIALSHCAGCWGLGRPWESAGCTCRKAIRMHTLGSLALSAAWPLRQPQGLCRALQAGCSQRRPPSTSTMHHAAMHLRPSVSERLHRYKTSPSNPVAARPPAH